MAEITLTFNDEKTGNGDFLQAYALSLLNNFPSQQVRSYLSWRMAAYNRSQRSLARELYSQKGASINNYHAEYPLYKTISQDFTREELGLSGTFAEEEMLTTPIVYASVDSARAWLANTFLTATPIFEVAGSPNTEDIALQYNAIYESDSRRYAWKSNLSTCFFTGLISNWMMLEVKWRAEKVPGVRVAGEAQAAEAPADQIIYQGNSLTFVDPFNAVWDTSVNPKDVHKEGEFVGYTQKMSFIRFAALLRDLGVSAQKQKELYELGGKGNTFYAERSFDYAAEGVVTPQDPFADIGNASVSEDERKKRVGLLKPFHVTKLYLRIIPSVFDLGVGDADPTAPQIFEAWLVGGELFHLRLLEENHGFFPIVCGVLLDTGDGWWTQSFSHQLEGLQYQAGKLATADIQSARKAIADRMIYNSHYVDKAHIENPNPASKIPVKKLDADIPLNAVVYPIPYSDPAMGMRTQLAQSVVQQAFSVSGLNQVQQGLFVKGNKTDSQFQESMGASAARMFQMAQNLEDTFFAAVKEVTLRNILAFEKPSQVISQQTGQQINISPEQLKSIEATFKVSDGLESMARLMKTDVLQVAIQSVMQIPDLSMQYNIPEMVMYLLKVQGLKNPEQFKLTPEEQQAKLDQQVKLMQAQAMAENQPAPQGGGGV